MNKNIFVRLFSIIVLIFGLFLLCTGFYDALNKSYKYKDYVSTKGYFMQYDIKSSNKDKIKYELTYSYVVDNYTYFVKSDNVVTKLPQLGLEKKVRYNPKNPKKSFVVEVNIKDNLKYIIVGIIFITLSSFILTSRILNRIDEKIIKIIGTILGLILISIGVYIYYTLGIVSNSWALSDVYETSKLFVLIPFILVLIGMLVVIIICFFEEDDSKKLQS